MNDEFFTQALTSNRYLKAIQLINRFESELKEELIRFGDRIVEANQDQFEYGVEASWNNSRSSGSGSVIAFARVDYDMDRRNSSDDDASNLTLNISFRWVEPGGYGHPDVEGAFTLLSYKLKHVREDDYNDVKQRTREEDWSIEFADDAFRNAPGIFYVPVETAEEMEEAERKLQNHFAEFVTMYGVKTE